MRYIAIESREDVAVIRLNNKVTNALSPGLVGELSSALTQVKNEFLGIILAGGAKFFSIGFDLPSLLELDRKGMTRFFYEFNQAAFSLFTMPLPTGCAMAGHAIAGGNILALTCDYRFAASGEKLIGLNEVRLGVPVPYLADLMLRQIVSDRAATEIIYHGQFITVSEAEKIGLVDNVVPQEKLEDYAAEKIAELAALPREAFIAIKANRVDAIRLQYEKNYMLKHETFLDCWFSKPTQALLSEAARKF
ncbi:MAG: enoyl-CoA hydratase/isomerase family protein [Thermodesulfobacteriota bacterium]